MLKLLFFHAAASSVKKSNSSVKKSSQDKQDFCHEGEPTPSTLTLVAEKSLTRPLPLREIRA
jgi:hypothetical protein